MANFEYRAQKTDGTVTQGVIDASNRQEAIRRLEGRQLRPIRLTEQAAGAKSAGKDRKPVISFKFGSKKVPYKSLENFTRQLASLLAAGVPLARSLQILCRESSNAAAQAKWKEVHDLVIDGTSLADSMGRSPETFPKVYVAMVQAGETGGFLDLVLNQIAEFQLREKDLRGRINSAMIYPAVLLSLAVAVLIFLLVFFIPRFKTLFTGFGAQLPILTQIIVKASEIAIHYGIFVALGIAAAIYFIRTWLKTDQGNRAWQQLLLKLPVVGPLAARFAMTRFCRMLGTLVGAGVPLLHSLKVARESIGNQVLIDALTRSIDRVQQGDSLASSLSECKVLFPNSVIEMISVAEETGKIDKELVRLATSTDGDLDRQLRTAVSLAEPLLLFLMAAFIGTIFVGMVLPIFSLQDYIK